MATIILSEKTQAILDEQLHKWDGDADGVILAALNLLSHPPVGDYDELDDDTKAAIEESERQFARGEFLTLDQLREQLGMSTASAPK